MEEIWKDIDGYDGIYQGSIIEASKETNVSYKKITHNILGEQKTADGYIFSKTLI